jgi:hypothetical protein
MRAAAGALVIMAGFAIATVATSGSLLNPGPQGESAAVAEIGDVVAAALPATPDGEGYLVIPRGFSLFEMFFGVVNHLDAAGIEVVTEPDFLAHFGPARTLGGANAPSPDAGTIAVVSGEFFDEVNEDPSWQLIAVYDPLTASQRAELTRLQDQLAEQLVAQGRSEQADWVRDRRVLEIVRTDSLGLSPDEIDIVNVFAFAGDRQRVFVKLADTPTPP